jgi:hypothetical protein
LAAGPNGTGHTKLAEDCDDAVVRHILVAASGRHVRTMGEFGQFVRPYLAAGYQREVNEAHRRYFDLSSQDR